MTKKLVKALDDLYRGAPSEFIEGRDALAKVLRTSGDEEDASRVKALRKPSKAAAVVNALALEHPKPVKRYIGLAEKLRKATSGKVDAARMRALAREEGELLEELVAEARKLGDRASPSTLDRVRETLQAAQVDDGLRERLVAGRVEREERAASVGLDNLAAPPVATPREKPGAANKAASVKKSGDADRKRRSEARAELKAAQAEARAAAREVARAEGALAKAERSRDAADRKAERAEQALARLS